MGVSRHEIIIYGISIGYETYNEAGGYDKFEDKYDFNKKKDGIIILQDGMSGKYCIVGVGLFIGGDHRFDDENDIPLIEIKEPESIVEEVIIDFVKEKFNVTGECKIYALSHYW